MSKASSKGKRRGRRERPLPVIHQDAAGIDVGSRFHVVAVGADRSDEPVRSYQSFTGDLERLADWLEEVALRVQAHLDRRLLTLHLLLAASAPP